MFCKLKSKQKQMSSDEQQENTDQANLVLSGFSKLRSRSQVEG
jgi:hypothetical protein